MSAPYRSRRPVLAVLVAAAILGVAGCGGDDEEGATTQATGADGGPPERTVTAPVRTAPRGERTDTGAAGTDEDGGKGGAGGSTSPEDSPGGAGDEEAATSEAVLTGRGGKIGPLVVKVPPFIAIRVVLRSGDGKPYVVTIGGKTLRAGFKGAKPSATFDGLRPGKRLLGSAVSGRVVIEASAEPGP